MKRTSFAIVVLAVISLAGDFLCRSQANLAGRDKLLHDASERVHLLPDRIGPWRMVQSEPLEEGVLRMLQCKAHESRVYVDDQTGESVALILLTGRSGPLLAHTPEVCYRSVDYETIDPAHPETFRGTGDSADEFNNVTFRTRTLDGRKERVYYAWRKAQGPWLAPKNPRLTLGGQPMLYKLQLAANADQPPAPDPARRFLDDLLPVLDTTLRPQ